MQYEFEVNEHKYFYIKLRAEYFVNILQILCNKRGSLSILSFIIAYKLLRQCSKKAQVNQYDIFMERMHEFDV